MERIYRKTDVAYKYGCGRFILQENALDLIGGEISAIGKKAFVIGGPHTLPIVKDKLVEEFAKSGVTAKYVVFDAPCSHDDAMLFAENDTKGYDVIVGVGGGRLMDFSKLVAEYSGLPVALIPTASGTCACYAPLSVCYNRDGTTVGTVKFLKEVSLVVVDTAVLCKQPARLMLAGAYDAMAKLIEIRHRTQGAYGTEYIGMRLGYAEAEFVYNVLRAELPKALEDVKAQRVSRELEDVVYCSTVGAGLCSGLANGSNQTAIGHKFYEFSRTYLHEEVKGFLHGELVAVGLIAQLYFNDEPEEAEKLRKELRDSGLPASVSDLGVTPTDELFNTYFEALKGSSALKNADEARIEKAGKALKTIFI